MTAVDDDLVAAFARLLPQLSPSTPVLQREELEGVVGSPGTTVLVALMQGSGGALSGEWGVVGTLTLVVFLIPTGIKAWIEDVVVESSMRGFGVGAALVKAGVQAAGAAGARTVELTSRPAREAANRLYRRLGFALRDTNVYRLDLF